MLRHRVKKVVIWQGPQGCYFLCRILNVGRSTDDLKVIVTHSDSNTGALYTEGQGRFTGGEVVSLHAEVTYHGDGTVLLKMPAHSDRRPTEYRNPAGTGVRRVALREVRNWEPFARYTVVRAVPLTRPIDDDVIVAKMSPILAGPPFQCTFWVGPTSLKAPTSDAHSADLRIPGVGQELDLLLRFQPSSYRGEVMTLPNTGKPIFVCNNILQVVEYQPQVRPQ